MSEQTTETPAARRHIIKRPRLTRLLDETTARIILLVAPAGYGKTTLAREWCESRSYTAWYQCTPPSNDVAALAIGVADALRPFAPEASARVRERIRLTPARGVQVTELVDGMVEEFRANQILLVLDDFHRVDDSPPGLNFVESLLDHTTMRVLIATRQKPRWALARKILYGEILEIGPQLLALNHDEASTVLRRRSVNDVSWLIAAAKGWPAVIGLAALTDGPIGEIELSGSLYDYFAEELLDGMPAGVQPTLLELALLPSITPDAIKRFASDDVMRRARNLGFLTRDGTDVESFHPLLQNFLFRRFLQAAPHQLAAAIDAVGSYLVLCRRWDDALTLLAEFPSTTTLITRLLEYGLDDLLIAGRVSTVEGLIRMARERKLMSAPVDLAEAELALRNGKHYRAHSLAISALSNGASRNTALRALLLAGRSANLSDQYDLSFDDYCRALDIARSSRDKIAALWGKFTAAYFTERLDLDDILTEMIEVGDASDYTAIRITIARFYVASEIRRDVRNCLDLFRATEHLIHQADDPVMAASYLQAFAYASVLTGEYAETLKLADDIDDLIATHSLSFARPLAHATRGYGQFGLGRYSEAAATASLVEDEAAALDDAHTALNARQLRARILLASAEFDEALRVSALPLHGHPSKSVVGEMLATRALAHACLGQWSQAGGALANARRLTRSLESSGLAIWTEAVMAALRGATAEDRAVTSAVADLEATGHVDAFVVAVRACPRLGGALAPFGDRISLGLVGSLVASWPSERPESLSPREREVAALISAGLTNREIARSLVISEATVKVHVRHILEKLHARSRAEVISRLVVREATRLPGVEAQPERNASDSVNRHPRKG